MTEYMGTSKAAEKFKVSKTTVSRWCNDGKLPGAKQDGKGKPWRIPVDAKPTHWKKK